MQATAEGKKILAENAVTGQGLPAYGTQVLMNVINEVGALPTHNHRDVQFDGAKNISAEAMAEPRADGKPNLVTNAACFGCTIACGRISTVERTHYTVAERPQYQVASGGLEYEAAWALGAATGVDDLDALTFANFICNEQGFDPISFGATVGAAMELYEEGAIGDEQTGGIELKFGSAKALTDLAELCGKGEGFGAEIGLGSKRLCEKYGRPELSMSVKGQEFPAYDSRGIQGMGLAYATANRGACHLARLHRLVRDPGRAGEDGSPRDRGQGGAGQGLPGRHVGGRFVRALRVHHLCLVARRHRAADRRSLRGRVDGGAAARSRRAHLEPGSGSTTPRRASRARTTTCPRVCSRTRRRPARPRASPTASTRCCRNITRCAAGPTTACPATRPWSASLFRSNTTGRRVFSRRRIIRHSRDGGGPDAPTMAPVPLRTWEGAGVSATRRANPGHARSRVRGTARRAKREPTCNM